MDDLTFKRLKESNYYHPEITEVIYDNEIMFRFASDAILTSQIGFAAVWDRHLCNWASKYFSQGIELVKNRVKEKDIKVRQIAEVTIENKDFIQSLDPMEIRHLDGLRGNFGIFDNRAYMVFVLHKDTDEPLQTFFSNSKVLVGQQITLFEKLWDLAIPLSTRLKEIEYEDKTNPQRIIINYENIQREIHSLISICKKELTIYSSHKILCNFLNKNNILNSFPRLIEMGVSIKILTDKPDEHLMNKIITINNLFHSRPIQIGQTNKLGNADEMVIISDNKHLIRVNYDQDNRMVATFSNEEYNVLIQELMFEKYWNELKSLEVMNNN
jgi:hypothetical protein